MIALILSLFAKSAVVAGAGLVLSRLVARPSDRADMLRAAVLMLLALPVLAVVVPAISLQILPAPEPAAVTPMWAGEARVAEGVSVTGAVALPGWGAVIGVLWLIGGAVMWARFVAGVLTLAHWTEEGRDAPVAWRAMLNHLSPTRRPRLVQTARIDGPLSWGVRPGAILIDDDSAARDPDAAQAILAHELAHIRRGDWVFLALSRLALALFWFNPLVWRLHAELAERSEEAADALAVQGVDRDAYARTLVRVAATAPIPSLFAPMRAGAPMAADARTLKTRIKTLMARTPAQRRTVVAVSALLLAAVATPLAAVELDARLDPPSPPEAPQAPALPAVPPAPPSPPEGMTGAHYVYEPEDGVVFINGDPAEGEEARRAAEEARAHAEQMRAHAEMVRQNGETIRAEVMADMEVMQRHAEEMRAHAEQIRSQAAWVRDEAAPFAQAVAVAVAQADRESAEAIRQARQAQREAGEAMRQARVEMRRGAQEMRRGADEMRRESDRLRDPAYRARQIEDNRRRGQTVTDAQLRDLIPSLRMQADALDEAAEQMDAESRDA